MTLESAIILAVTRHSGQVTKDGGDPYIIHPLRVMLRLSDDKSRKVGVLHDIIEDTNTTLDELRELGLEEDEVIAIDALSRRKNETYPEFIERVAQNPLAKEVKIIDINDNLDEKRLAKLEPSHAEYFRNKYRPALARLSDDPKP